MSAQKVLLTLFPGAIAFECMAAVGLLGERGFGVEVATPSGREHREESGLTIAAQHAFRDVDPTAYRAVLVPGGNLAVLIDDTDIDRVVRGAYDAGKCVAAICAGPIILMRNDLLVGREYVQGGWYPSELQPLWERGTFVRRAVVVQGQVITALAEGHVDFAIEVARQLGAFEDDAAAEAKRRRLKGDVTDRDWSIAGPV